MHSKGKRRRTEEGGRKTQEIKQEKNKRKKEWKIREKTGNLERKKESERKNREWARVWWWAWTNRLFPSLPLTAYSLVRIKEFEEKPSRLILSKWAISVAGLPCEIAHIEEWFPFWTWLRWKIKHGRLIFLPFIDQALILFHFLFIVVINSFFLPHLYHCIIFSFIKKMI